MSWITFLLPLKETLGKLSVVLAPLLLLINLLMTVRADMPKADGMNALEIWLISCIFFVFVTFLE